MPLTPETVGNIATLARLELTPEELSAMTRQLASILDYVRQLDELDLNGVEPLAHAVDLQNVFREDEPAPSLSVAEALANAPRRSRDFYAVPAVLD